MAKKKSSTSAYIFSLDVVRALAIIGVVAIHVFLPIYTRPDFMGGISWWLAYSLNAISRPAVPLFLMVSGALLLPRKPKKEISDILQRVIFRIGLPLVFWAAVYFQAELLFYGRRPSLVGAIDTFFSGDVFHLYFLVILFNLYLLLPLWRSYLRAASQWQKKYILITSFTLGIVIYLLQFFLYQPRSVLNFFTFWVPHLGYFLAGDYIYQAKLSKNQLYLALVFFISSLIFTIAFGYYNLQLFSQNILTFWGVGGTEYFTHFLSPNIILLSLSSFILLTKGKTFLSTSKNQLYQKIIQAISRTAFGIYLTHLLLIHYLDRFLGFAIHQVHGQLWLYGLKKMVIVFGVSWAFSAVATKIPVIKLLFGEKIKGWQLKS